MPVTSSSSVSSPDYRVCSRCVMDSTDSSISFDADGVCDHCHTFDTKIAPNWHTDEIGQNKLQALTHKIKKAGRNKDFDCIIGMSALQ